MMIPADAHARPPPEAPRGSVATARILEQSRRRVLSRFSTAWECHGGRRRPSRCRVRCLTQPIRCRLGLTGGPHEIWYGHAINASRPCGRRGVLRGKPAATPRPRAHGVSAPLTPDEYDHDEPSHPPPRGAPPRLRTNDPRRTACRCRRRPDPDPDRGRDRIRRSEARPGPEQVREHAGRRTLPARAERRRRARRPRAGADPRAARVDADARRPRLRGGHGAAAAQTVRAERRARVDLRRPPARMPRPGGMPPDGTPSSPGRGCGFGRVSRDSAGRRAPLPAATDGVRHGGDIRPTSASDRLSAMRSMASLPGRRGRGTQTAIGVTYPFGSVGAGIHFACRSTGAHAVRGCRGRRRRHGVG